MRRVISIGLIVLHFFCVDIKAQNNDSIIRRNTIGIQYNPYIDSELFGNFMKKRVVGLKYGYRVKKWLTYGPEFSFFNYRTDFSKHDFYNISIFGRAIYPKYKIKPFSEIYSGLTYFYFYANHPTYKNVSNKFFGTVGFNTGISFNIFKDIITFDIYYKFSNKFFINDKKSVFSYKLCVTF